MCHNCFYIHNVFNTVNINQLKCKSRYYLRIYIYIKSALKLFRFNNISPSKIQIQKHKFHKSKEFLFTILKLFQKMCITKYLIDGYVFSIKKQE